MKNKRRTKVILISAPFTDVSGVPVGIAQLKSYAEQLLPSVSVRTLDLNITLFNDLAQQEFRERFRDLCLRYLKKDQRQTQYLKDVFNHYGGVYARGSCHLRSKDSKEFRDIAQYNFSNKIVLNFFRFCAMCLAGIFDDIIERKRAFPKPLERFLLKNIEAVLEEKPALIGFSIFAREQLSYSLALASLLKKKTTAPIVFGGAFMAHIEASSFLEIFKWIDFVVMQEGETGLTALIRHLKDKRLEEVPGLFYRRKNTIIHNREEFIKNLDDLPFPDFSDFDLDNYFLPVPALPIIFSRGCSWKKCAFCTYYKNYPLAYKIKSVERCIQELKYFAAKGIKYFMISDDTIPAAHLDLLSTAIRKEKLDIFFGFIARPEKHFSFRILKNIYRAGGRYISWGVETSNQRILDLMNKGTKVEDIARILKHTRKIGFNNHLFMIQGFPTETKKEIRHDIKFLQTHHSSAHLHPFVLVHGSFIFHHPKKFAIKALKRRPLYSVKGKTLFSSSVLFQRRNTLKAGHLNGEERVLGKLFSQNIGSPSHLILLIHASMHRFPVQRPC